MNEAQAQARALAGRPDLKDFGGAAPLEKDADPAPSRPVDDDPAPRREERQDDPSRNEDDPPRRDDDDDNSERKGPPADDARAKIYAKFDARREAEANGEEPPGEDGEGGDPPENDNTADDTSKAPAKPGPSDSGDKDGVEPKRLTLVVHDKSRQMTVEEVAALSELSVEEVNENPARAIKFAQRELATRENLARSRDSRRDQPARPDTRQDDRTAPNQERTATGDDDARGQPDPDRKTTGDVDFVKLVEDIQIADPKEAGQKVREAFDTAARRAAVEAVSEQEQQRRSNEDRTTARASMSKFVEAHPEVQGNEFMAPAIAKALIHEYRDDLRTAMIAEGDDPAEVARIFENVTDEQVAQAHKVRRMRGDPNVRKIDVPFFEKAYSRVTESLGVKPGQQQQQQQQGLQQRQERKRALPHQPTRASVPPATPPAPVKPPSRSEVVQQMRRDRGQKSQHAR